jgi:hypothetical protein
VGAKRNVLKSQLPLMVIAATVVLLTLLWLVYHRGPSRCDSIFEQTTDRVRADLEFIKIKGELTLGREKIQELTDSSQKVALHLKSCCIAQEAKALNAEQFQTCMSGAKDYQTQIIQVATNVKEAAAAEEQQKPELAKQKIDAAKDAASKVNNTEKSLSKLSETLPPVHAKDAEQEPNNTVQQANIGEIGATIAGEINPANDVDFFQFKYSDAKKRRDIIVVRLENRSSTLQPQLTLRNQDKSIARDWTAANAPGADLNSSFLAEPEKIYFVGAGSAPDQHVLGARVGNSAGAYALSLLPQKAYDQYEPNDDALSATPLKVGQTVEANVMDGEDLDYYRVSGIKEKNLTVQLENLSPLLQPSIRVLKSDKSIAENWKSANAPGTDLTFSIASEPGQDYFIEVASAADPHVFGSAPGHGPSSGRYKLTVR